MPARREAFHRPLLFTDAFPLQQPSVQTSRRRGPRQPSVWRPQLLEVGHLTQSQNLRRHRRPHSNSGSRRGGVQLTRFRHPSKPPPRSASDSLNISAPESKKRPTPFRGHTCVAHLRPSPGASVCSHRRFPKHSAPHREIRGSWRTAAVHSKRPTRAPLPCYSPLPLLLPWRSARCVSHGARATAGSGQEKAISTSCRPWLSSGNVAAGRLRIAFCARA